MDKRDKYNDDFLRSYIDPEKIEKAPAEFTSKTMTRIRLEAASHKPTKVKAGRWVVPVLSVLVTTALITAALIFIPSEGGSNLLSRISDLVPDIRIVLPHPDFGFLSNINLPGWMVYGTACIIFLALFDRALWGLFHREK